jgi:hypothetical protein
VVTEDTRHLFSTDDIAAWDEAVSRHAGDFDNDDDLDDEMLNRDVADVP